MISVIIVSAIISPYAPKKVVRRTTRVHSTYMNPEPLANVLFCPRKGAKVKSSQVSTLPKAKSKTRSKQNKDMHKCSSVYSERGVLLPVLTSGGE